MGLNFYYYDGLQPKMSAGIINEHECTDCKNNWYTFFPNQPNCYIKTTLNGYGRAKIDFGNCDTYIVSVVKVFLNNNEIASAGPNTVSIVKEFDFTDGSELKLVEEKNGIISFNSFEVLNCNGGKINLINTTRLISGFDEQKVLNLS